jgi:hypothetical protein
MGRAIVTQMTGDEMSGAFQSSHVNTYDTLLVPLMVSPYASAVADVVRAHDPKKVLELAAGTGSSLLSWRGFFRQTLRSPQPISTSR